MKALIISKLNELGILFGGFLLCAFLLTIRIKTTGSFTYLFLVWNIFLAIIPYAISFMLKAYPRIANKKWVLLPLCALWLLFLPNTPYLISDLQHLRFSPTNLLGYDVLMLVTFVWYAMLILFFTVRDMQEIGSHRMSAPWLKMTTFLVFLLCGFGIYLGRYLRWNSWDIIQNPLALILDILNRIRHPFNHSQTWLITLGYAIFIGLFYQAMNYLGALQSRKHEN